MKKNSIKYLSVAGLILAIMMFCRCSDDSYSEKYPDPAKISDPTCEKLMTGVFQQSVGALNPGSGGFSAIYIGSFAQVLGRANAGGRFEAESYSDPFGQWNGFYNSMTAFRVLENLYSKLSNADKAENEIFLLIAQLYLYERLAAVTSVWGDMPYSEAGTLPLTGNIAASTPKYDSQESIYRLLLTDLKELNNKLATIQLSTPAATKLATQDYIHNGDILKWRRWANSLRLRVGIRLSSQGGLQAEGKAAVAEILGNEATYPIPTDNDDMVAMYTTAGPDRRWTDLGYNDASRQHGLAAHAHLSRMLNNNDPRLEITYEPGPGTGLYAGLNPSLPYNSLTDNATDIKLCYSSVDSSSFRYANEKIPALVFSAAEIWFIKAEAYQRGIAPGNAEAAFKKAVDLSVKMYYSINSGATYKPPVPLPDQSEIDAFTNARWAAIGSEYATAEEAIATQKWLNFGFMQAYEAWAELRRTGLPRLRYATDLGARCPNIPSRLRYPDNERRYNPENCPRIEDDNWETSLYWAKDDWCEKFNLE
ncbi:MAG: SusD/RagB family nutrient-binding outer membrane lipoprotein [Tannerella sp.]|jgi:hypothetical protein|nr:SusD/RagB family nutrient-binding outer membrane lipoprotein [Tannerella sp.]